MLQHGSPCIVVGKPDAHPPLSERVALWQANDGMAALARRPWHGRSPAVPRYRDIHNVLLRAGDDAVSVQGCERTVVHAHTGAQRSHHSLITHHRVTAALVAAVAHAGRGRWKIANENNHGLKTTGSHVEPHVGHGKKSLSALRLSLNLLACLVHTVLAWSDDTSALRRRVLARRQTFFEDIRA